ncbi:hypothetical protein ACI3ER_11980 [Bacillus sp. Wb]
MITIKAEEAQAIQLLKAKLSNENIVKEFMEKDHSVIFEDSNIRVLKYIDLDTLIKAIYVGYKIKPKPDALVREHFQSGLENARSDDEITKYRGRAIVEAIKLFAEAYDIEINGVTDVDIGYIYEQ